MDTGEDIAADRLVALIERQIGSSLSRFQVLLFDLDGTLADTMSLHYRAYAEALREWGGELTREAFDAVAGGPAAHTIPQFIARSQPTGEAPTAADVHIAKKRVLDRLLLESAPNLLAVAALVPRFNTTHRLGVVTSGNRYGATNLLERLFGQPSPFAIVVTGDDVVNGKPHPAPYLLAAQQLNVAGDDCLVFEDHPAGIASAQAAGMMVIDVATLTQ